MEVLINNPQKGRLETINVEFTKNNTTWFAVKDKGIKMITDFEGGLLITEWGYTYPLLVYDITRADIGYDHRKAQKIMKMHT
jgi:hypothetical protein